MNNLHSNKKPVYLIGDIHGEFIALKKALIHYDIRDCYLFCVGDLGIGFQHPNRGELGACKMLNDFFAERDIYFASIRGNHDDPQYFNGPKQILLSNFKLLSDYHSETINDQIFLFIGGAISVDRTTRIPEKSYWPNENFIYDESRIVECDVLVTHSAPQYIGPNDKTGIKYWCEVDKKLWDECLTERHYHDKLLAACKPKAHYCGHFHVSDSVEKDGCISRILDILEIKEHIRA
jgi:hypothetical protein